MISQFDMTHSCMHLSDKKMTNISVCNFKRAQRFTPLHTNDATIRL